MHHSTNPLRMVATIALVVAIGCGAAPEEAISAAPDASEAGSSTTAIVGSAQVSGSVTYAGSASTLKLHMEADPICHEQHATPVHAEEVVSDNGSLANVLVYVKDGLGETTIPAPSTAALLDQQGCLYTPHILAVQAGQEIKISNSDATLHNVNAKPSTNRGFNIAQPVKGMKTTKTFAKPEIGIPLKCNVHPWMKAYIHVLDHSFFAVTGADGSFDISGLPAGTYTVEAWHEQLGTKTQSVTVTAGQSLTADFSF